MPLLLPLLPSECFAFGVIVVKRRGHIRRGCQTWGGSWWKGGAKHIPYANWRAVEILICHEGGFLPATNEHSNYENISIKDLFDVQWEAYFSLDLGILGILFSSPLAKGPVAASTKKLNKSSWSRSAAPPSRSFRSVALRRKCNCEKESICSS